LSTVPDSKTLPASSHRALQLLVVLVSLFVVLLFLVAALVRLHYPYELEELEGYMFVAALRVFHGQTVYPRPSLNFIPYMYPPGYYYASAALGKLMGMTISTMRMVSILSTFGGFGMIYLLVWREVRRSVPAIAAVGLYAGCYTLTAEWFDLGRLDSFFILLVLIAMYATRHLHPFLAAICWTLAFQTKQSILPLAFLMLCWNWRDVRRTAVGVATMAIGAGGSVAYLNHISHGWYQFYVFRVPAASADLKLRTAILFWPVDMLRPLALAVAVIIAGALLTRPNLRGKVTHFYLAALAVVPLFWWIRTHGGSTVNALMPIYVLVAILFGISFGRLTTLLAKLDGQRAQTAGMVLMLAVLAQEAAGVYDPIDYRPVVSAVHNMDAMIAMVKAIPGPVYVVQHPYYGYLAGKPTQADLISLMDAVHGAPPGLKVELQRELQHTLEDHQYTALLFNREPDAENFDRLLGHRGNWRTYYEQQQPLFELKTVTGYLWKMEHCTPSATKPCIEPAH
jgi:hypothetical protein